MARLERYKSKELTERLGPANGPEHLATLIDEDLLSYYCEVMIATIVHEQKARAAERK